MGVRNPKKYILPLSPPWEQNFQESFLSGRLRHENSLPSKFHVPKGPSLNYVRVILANTYPLHPPV